MESDSSKESDQLRRIIQLLQSIDASLKKLVAKETDVAGFEVSVDEPTKQ